MTNQRALEKAIALVRQVNASLSKRRPRGMSFVAAQKAGLDVDSAVHRLEAAYEQFQIAEDRRQSGRISA